MSNFDKLQGREAATPGIAIVLWGVGWMSLALCGIIVVMSMFGMSYDGGHDNEMALVAGLGGVVSALVLMALAKIVQKLNQIAASVAEKNSAKVHD